MLNSTNIKQISQSETSEAIARMLEMTRDEYDQFCFELACEWVKFRQIGRLKQLDVCFVISNSFHSWFRTQVHNLNIEILHKYRTIDLAHYIQYILHNLRFLPSIGLWNQILSEGTSKLEEKPELKSISL